MKKSILILFTAALTGGYFLSSCNDDFLKEEVKSSYSPENTLKDSLGFEAAIAGLHNVNRFNFTRSSPQGVMSIWHVGTDVAISVNPDGENPYWDYTLLNSEDVAAKSYWQWAYELINNANLIIFSLEGQTETLSEGFRNRTNAEAKFFRAYAYNFLVTLYGGVPIVEKPLSAPKTDFKRASVAEVNDLIVSDLTFAITNLYEVNKVSKPGRINKAAARQLLAEVYLRAGKPDLAEQQCLEIINSKQFNLVTARYGIKKDSPGDPFSDMFIYGNQRKNQGNAEAIWVIEQEFNIPGGNNSADQSRRMWVASYYNSSDMLIADSLGGRGLARLRLSNKVLYGLYENNDMRNSKYNIRRTFYYNNPKSAKYGKKVVLVGKELSDTIAKFTPYTTKWNHYIATDEFGTTTYKDHIIMRLGETYLLLAEAQFKQGKLTEAAASINIIRVRAKATPVTAGDITLSFILDERARELIAEENRRMTLVRTGTLLDRVAKYNAAFVKGIEPFHALMPIPQSEIDLNKDAQLEQNPGY